MRNTTDGQSPLAKDFLPLRTINRENGTKFNSFHCLVKLIINSLISTYLLDG